MNVTEYDIPWDRDLTIALVTDLHERDPEPLLVQLGQLRPDLICVAGDTFERFRVNGHLTEPNWMVRLLFRLDDLFLKAEAPSHSTENAYRFVREAGSLAPVFLSLGNHEAFLNPEDRTVLEEAGAVLLDNRFVSWQGLTIGGLSSLGVHTPEGRQFLQEFSAEPGRKILLCHHPEYYDNHLSHLPIDLILSGHAHGGQVRLFGRGLFSPGQGLLPRYHRGLYHGRLAVSAGCANTAAVPRFGNPTELVALHCRNRQP